MEGLILLIIEKGAFIILGTVVLCLLFYAIASKKIHRTMDISKDIEEKLKVDEDDVNVASGEINHIIVPDEVDIDDATLKSTQDVDCKKYSVEENSFVRNSTTSMEEVKEILQRDDDEVEKEAESNEDDPIKENNNEGVISKIFGSKKDEE